MRETLNDSLECQYISSKSPGSGVPKCNCAITFDEIKFNIFQYIDDNIYWIIAIAEFKSNKAILQ